MSFRAISLALFAIAIFAAGCANTPRLRRDVFATSNQRSRPLMPDGDRDPVRDVSTSPATDPFFGDIGMRQPNPQPASYAERNEEPRDDVIPPAKRESQNDVSRNETPVEFAGDESVDGASSDENQRTPRIDYESVRKRLDAANAQNWRTERDEQDEKYLFYCEVPIPGKPDLARAFEARDENELRAMLAVTEAIEDWIRDGQADE